MSFLERLFKMMGDRVDESATARPTEAPPFGGTLSPPEGTAALNLSPEGQASEYDRALWRKKLKSLLDRIPDSESEWTGFVAETSALGLDPTWVRDCMIAEFEIMIRKIVGDRIVSSAEYHKLDRARALVAISDQDAEAMLERVVADAEAFFGKPVRRD
jgi:hypothetical protein